MCAFPEGKSLGHSTWRAQLRQTRLDGVQRGYPTAPFPQQDMGTQGNAARGSHLWVRVSHPMSLGTPPSHPTLIALQ